MESGNARLGLQLFCIYLLLYLGFVLTNAFAPTMMEATPVAGINLAILCGFGLIIGAFLMSLIYGFLCQPEDAETASKPGGASAGADDRSHTAAEETK